MASPQQQLDPRYLRGVIDALELVISFLDWLDANPGSSRTAKEFIRQSLKKLEEKSSQKLDEALGVDVEE